MSDYEKYLFRGKAKNGIWVKGGFHKHETRQPHCCEELNPEEIKYLIIVDSLADWNMPKSIQCVEVIPETVGQNTGSTDKNCTKIFEGDIVQALTRYGTKHIYPIEYRNGTYWFGNWNWIEFLDRFQFREVIGNIHDNPELLGGGPNDQM